MVSKIIHIVLLISFLSLQMHPSIAKTWIRAGYYRYDPKYELEFPISEINTAFFTHILCAFADVNSTTYQLALTPSDENHFSSFTKNLKQMNPSVTTLLSIGGDKVSNSNFSSMVSNPSYRKSFIDSTIEKARLYGFEGLDLSWQFPRTSSDMKNLGILFEEWQTAIALEARNARQSPMILTATVYYSPFVSASRYPIDKMQRHLNWVQVFAAWYSMPVWKNFTAAHAALYDLRSINNTDYGISRWIEEGLLADKLVLCLPFYGYAWTLVNPEDNGIGAPAKGPAISDHGHLTYNEIKNYIAQYGANIQVIYDQTYVVNYCTIGTSWIGFDDVKAIKAKVSYAKDKGLLGYYVWQVSFDVNWVLSQTADNESGQNKRRLLIIVLTTIAAFILLLANMIYCCWRRKLIKSRLIDPTIKLCKRTKDKVQKAAANADFSSSVPNLKDYTLTDIEAATNCFSNENKLGQGGYGPVFKGVLPDGQEIAVKKLSKTSKQGFEEFKNEVMLTVKLQHVNLVGVLGYCIDKEEYMLIYEYMRNKSLDTYLFEPSRQHSLDWKKRVHIIEGVTQGLLYLQEYSRFTIIHRDLKASNILLDEHLNPKISDFGMARIFAKSNLEVNTGTIVGTFGYVPPEYLRKGTYSTKSDVYSFGVLLLEIVSGKKVSRLYIFLDENLNLLEYAYELWKDGKGMEFMDPSLDDTDCSYKLIRCLQIALICVQENPNDRPTMLEVSTMLKNETVDMMVPNKPAAFWKPNNGNKQSKATMHLEICSGRNSINNVTLTEVVAR